MPRPEVLGTKVVTVTDSNLRRTIYLSGWIGSIIVAATSLITAIAYEGEFGDSYSFLNHNISELGETTVSELAWVFNVGLIVGGLAFAVFMVSLGRYVRTTAMTVIAAVGTIAALGISAVGVFPIGPPEALGNHTLAALTFFLGGFVFTTAFTVYVLRSSNTPFPRWLAVASGTAALSFILFLFLPSLVMDIDRDTMLEGPSGPDRPTFWLPSFLEWMIMFATVTWILITSEVVRRSKLD